MKRLVITVVEQKLTYFLLMLVVVKVVEVKLVVKLKPVGVLEMKIAEVC